MYRHTEIGRASCTDIANIMEGETVHIKMEGKMVDILKKLDIKLYCKYITTDNVRPVLYVDLKKSLYGTLRSALLFWRNLTSSLQEWVFEVNP